MGTPMVSFTGPAAGAVTDAAPIFCYVFITVARGCFDHTSSRGRAITTGGADGIALLRGEGCGGELSEYRIREWARTIDRPCRGNNS